MPEEGLPVFIAIIISAAFVSMFIILAAIIAVSLLPA